MATSKTRARPAERTQPTETPTPGLFVHAASAPECSDGDFSNQCRFGGYWVINQEPGGHYGTGTRVQVYRNTRNNYGDLSVGQFIHGHEVACNSVYMTADEMQRLACALLDAAHHMRTQPASSQPEDNRVMRKDAQAVSA